MNVARKQFAFVVTGLLIAAIVPAAAFFLVPGFVRAFSAFPELLPVQTRILFSYYQLTPLFPLIVLAAWYYLRSSKHPGALALVLSIFGTILLLALGWWAMTPQVLVLEAIKRSYQ